MKKDKKVPEKSSISKVGGSIIWSKSAKLYS